MQAAPEQKAPKIEVRQVAERPCLIISGRVAMSAMPTFLQQSYGKLYPYAKGKAHECFARYPSWTDTECVVEAGVVTAEPLPAAGEILASTVGGRRALYSLHKGPYEQIAAAYEAMQKTMKEQNLVSGGAPYEMYLNDPSIVASADLMTEIYWPIK